MVQLQKSKLVKVHQIQVQDTDTGKHPAPTRNGADPTYPISEQNKP